MSHPTVFALHPRCTPDHVGFIPTFLDDNDPRPDAEKPKFDRNALAGGGAFVSAGAQKQVQGVAPPTKRE